MFTCILSAEIWGFFIRNATYHGSGANRQPSFTETSITTESLDLDTS